MDVLVAGGGPAGSAAAITLARAGLDVLLADATSSTAQQLKIGESLPPAARPLLDDLGLIDRPQASEHLPSYGIACAWNSSRVFDRDFVFDPHGHGWHLHRNGFDRSLRQAAADAGVDVREGVKVRSCEWGNGNWRVHLGDGHTARASALIDATGRRASVSRRLGARRQRHDRLVAVFGSALAHATDAYAHTLVEAVPNGWWYTALIPGGRRVAVLLTDSDLVPADARTPSGFRAALAQTKHVAPLIQQPVIELRTEPAHGSRLQPPCGERWLAVGDAALAFDPLSSQGITTALYTGLLGAKAIHTQLHDGYDALRRYTARIAAIWAAYQQNRIDVYTRESRWPQLPFWERRRSSLGAGIFAATPRSWDPEEPPEFCDAAKSSVDALPIVSPPGQARRLGVPHVPCMPSLSDLGEPDTYPADSDVWVQEHAAPDAGRQGLSSRFHPAGTAQAGIMPILRMVSDESVR